MSWRRPVSALVASSVVAAGLVLVAPVAQPVSTLPSAAAEESVAPLPAPGVPAGELDPVRLQGLSTATSNTFLLPNGSHRLEVAMAPVNYRDESGGWQPIDNTLVDAPGSTYAVENAANDFTASIPADASASPVRVEAGGAWVTMQMQGADAAPVVDGATARFDEVDGADSVTYEATGSGLKESITLDSPPALGSASYVYAVEASAGITAVLTAAGALEFRDPQGEVRFEVPVGSMSDSAVPEPAYSDAVGYDLAPVSGGWELTVTPDAGWLADPARVYPVVIDPTVNTKDATDCWAEQANPTTSHCGSNTPYIKVGKTGPNEKRRGLLDFDIDAIPDQATVNSAELRLYLDKNQTTGTGSATEYGVFNIKYPFNNNASWNGPGTGAGGWTGGCGCASQASTNTLNLGGGTSEWKTFQVKPLVEHWLAGTWEHGMVLKQVNDDSDRSIAFRSSAFGSSLPVLVVDYDDPADPAVAADVGERDFWTFASRDLTDTMTAKVNIGNGNLLVESQDLTLPGIGGWDLALSRYYNSADATVGQANIGMGWSTSLADSVRLGFPNGAGDRERVFFYGPSGYRAAFDRLHGGGYQRQGAGITADLSFDNGADDTDGTADDRFVLRWFDESEYVFTGGGDLEKTRDKNHNEITFSYTDGHLQSAVDTRNRRLDFQYNANGLVENVKLLNANTVEMMRWTYAYVPNVTPALLNSVTVETTSETAVGGTAMADGTDPYDGSYTSYDYDASNRLVAIHDARETAGQAGGTTSIDYDGATSKVTQLTRETDDDPGIPNSVTTFTYQGGAGGAGDICSSKDINNKDATARTTLDGERTSTPDSATYPNDPLATDAADTSKYCVDNRGRVVRTTDPAGVKRSAEFTTNSNVVAADMAGLGDGQAQYSITYDGNDNATSVTSPDGARGAASYSDPDHPHMTTQTRGDDTGGTSSAWDYSYTDAGNLKSAASGGDGSGDDPGIEYRYCWTSQGQIKRIDPVRATGTASNDTATDGSNCSSAAQGDDTIYTYSNDSEKNLTGIDRPVSGDTSYTYDNLSRIKSVTNDRGITTTYVYDAAGHTVRATHTKTGEATQTVDYTYDLSGNLVEIDDLNGTNTFTYDELNRKTSDSAQAPSGATSYTYDPAGNVIEVDVAGETVNGVHRSTRYSYDKLNLLVTLTDQRNQQYTFGYDNHDKRTKTVYPVAGGGGNVVQEARYNNDGDMVCIYSYRADNPPDDDTTNGCPEATSSVLLTYQGYDYENPDLTDNPNTGRNEKKTGTKYAVTDLGGDVTRFQYDDIKRLKTAKTRTDNTTNSTAYRTFSYGYDRHSNLTSEQVAQNGTTTPGLTDETLWMPHDFGDQICRSKSQSTDPNLTCTTSGTGITQYHHDEDGNLETVTGDGVMSGTVLEYNLAGQTTSIDPPGTTPAASMAYDGVMQDRRTQAGNTSMAYGYAGLSAQSTSGTGAHAELFVRDPDGKLLAMITPSTGATRDDLTDEQQSVIATTDGSTSGTGTNLVRYLYEPYGQQIRSWEYPNAGTATTLRSRATATTPATDYNPWRYASGYHDPATGFLKFGTRYYMPQLGTWT